MSVKDIQQQIMEAASKGDMATVVKLAGEAKKAEKAEADSRLEAIRGELQELTEKIQNSFKSLVEKWGNKVIDLVGEDKAVIQLSWSPAEGGLTTTKITKSAPKKPGGGGGGPAQKFDMSTEDLIGLYGNEEYKDGKTFKDAWVGETDKNVKFNIRRKLIKRHTQGQ